MKKKIIINQYVRVVFGVIILLNMKVTVIEIHNTSKIQLTIEINFISESNSDWNTWYMENSINNSN